MAQNFKILGFWTVADLSKTARVTKRFELAKKKIKKKRCTIGWVDFPFFLKIEYALRSVVAK